LDGETLNELLKMLSGGSLISDGRANEAADRVLANPQLFDQLVEGLSEPESVIRARTAHALEKISRTHPEMVESLLPKFIEMATHDPVPMVRWHIAMIFGNLQLPAESVDDVIPVLFRMLEDSSVFVKSWALVSLTVLGRQHGSMRKVIADHIQPLLNDRSVAIRSKAIKAVKILENDGEPIPAGRSEERRVWKEC
jgi:HEAT repeat protein